MTMCTTGNQVCWMHQSINRPDDLERILEENHDAFVQYERQIENIKMSIDTGNHLPIAKKPYALALKHYNWVRDEIHKLLVAGVI